MVGNQMQTYGAMYFHSKESEELQLGAERLLRKQSEELAKKRDQKRDFYTLLIRRGDRIEIIDAKFTLTEACKAAKFYSINTTWVILAMPFGFNHLVYINNKQVL